jgi:hypothetical protein
MLQHRRLADEVSALMPFYTADDRIEHIIQDCLTGRFA